VEHARCYSARPRWQSRPLGSARAAQLQARQPVYRAQSSLQSSPYGAAEASTTRSAPTPSSDSTRTTCSPPDGEEAVVAAAPVSGQPVDRSWRASESRSSTPTGLVAPSRRSRASRNFFRCATAWAGRCRTGARARRHTPSQRALRSTSTSCQPDRVAERLRDPQASVVSDRDRRRGRRLARNRERRWLASALGDRHPDRRAIDLLISITINVCRSNTMRVVDTPGSHERLLAERWARRFSRRW